MNRNDERIEEIVSKYVIEVNTLHESAMVSDPWDRCQTLVARGGYIIACLSLAPSLDSLEAPFFVSPPLSVGFTFSPKQTKNTV